MFFLSHTKEYKETKIKNKQQEIIRNIKAPQKHETKNQSRAEVKKHTGRALGDKCTPLIPNQALHGNRVPLQMPPVRRAVNVYCWQPRFLAIPTSADILNDRKPT